MGFWFYMLISNLAIPLMMIGFGFAFLKHPPKRSTTSMATAPPGP